MKVLAGLVHVAVASQVVFDSHDPLNEEVLGTIVSKMIRRKVTFTLNTKIMEFESTSPDVAPITRLRINLCPSVNGLPRCTESNKPATIAIHNKTGLNKLHLLKPGPSRRRRVDSEVDACDGVQMRK
ncbi:hypothetical protein H310_13343 [Aphanomyces invadans]|uniref:Uncharacterized protein n=1 Tax=Aphanomyces invadans TaxID=157072 RepID=A0A024TG00_9STRA|nr:hypothetical protein H310_13343 [Aphanomyces invadans]ETV92282.1 hypothetical protein H310_13343 [Aphanomyces invadans]|eukprot:XP_008879033.1 hypothetical protein H310_13343 [Aphanomyces invadans]